MIAYYITETSAVMFNLTSHWQSFSTLNPLGDLPNSRCGGARTRCGGCGCAAPARWKLCTYTHKPTYTHKQTSKLLELSDSCVCFKSSAYQTGSQIVVPQELGKWEDAFLHDEGPSALVKLASKKVQLQYHFTYAQSQEHRNNSDYFKC